ncbi:MAG: SusC/RagA family TonB-linked outer membrane protein [Bacteroidales bacterium]|nr:SusC/RagA family TonB-linked outer membrane protein [Bacteroidales bacterium]
MKKIKVLLALVLSLYGVSLFAQNITVKGVVTDAANGEPLSGAAILVKGTPKGTVADQDGRYTITVPADATLGFTTIGFKDVEIEVKGRTVINVALESDSELLDEVTVVAFGTKRKQDLVGSVSSVKKGIIENTQSASVSDALEGAVAGLQVLSSSGQPGEDASIVIRGISSLSASNAALIVVDGSPYNGYLSDINPADIESITVSKDAVSNSLYGARASGGVVMVTTKTGKKDNINIRFNANVGSVQRAYKDYAMVTDNKEFYELTWYGLRNTAMAGNMKLDAESAALYASQNLLDEVGNYNAFIIPAGQYLVGTDGKLNPAAKVRYYDTFANALFQNSIRQNYDISASGATEKTDYYISAGYLNNKSYVIGSDYERFTARVNLNTQILKWLKVGMNVGFGRSTQNGVQESTSAASNPFDVAREWAPIYPVHAYAANGQPVLDLNGNPVYDAGTGQTEGTVSRPTATNQNVICSMNEDIRKTVMNTLTGKAYLEAKFAKHFTFNTNISYEYEGLKGTTYYTPTIGDGQSFNGRGTHSTSINNTINTVQVLSYDNIFGDNHNFSAKIGHEYYLYNAEVLAAQKTQFFDPSNPELVNGGEMQYSESYSEKHNIEGFFGMVDYNYASKYYLSAAYRRDGTSRFIGKNRWGNFWSVGIGWRLTGERWAQDAKSWLNDLKFRASYGTQGNERVTSGGYTPYVDQYGVAWDGTALGYSQVFYGNPNLTWESQNTVDAGVDFRLWNRVYGNVDYYMTINDGLLFQRPTATSTGRPYNWENIGKMQSQGVEVEINVDIFNKKDLRWSIGLVGAHNTVKMLTLPEENKADGITSGNFKLMEGKDRYEYFTYQYAGMDEKGNAQWWMDETEEDPETGEDKPTGNRVKTTTYSNATKYWTGKSAIPAFNGGLNTSFYFKGLDIAIQTAFQIGGWGYDSNYLSGMSQSFYVGHNKDLWNTFDPTTGKGNIPVWNADNSSNSYSQTSDAHLVTASYFSLKNVTVGYTFPSKWMSKAKIKALRIYAVADNVCLVSARQGYDPRVSISGGNSGFGGYSPLRSISGGIQLTF